MHHMEAEPQYLQLVLNSPVGGKEAVYTWPLSYSDKHDGAIEIIETIRWVYEDLPELKEAMQPALAQFNDPKCFESMKRLCDHYNSELANILARKNSKLPTQKASIALLKHIIQKSYNHAVTDPEKLNSYVAFSPSVYGETSFDFVVQMISEVEITGNDQFIDLGSGVGQVVMQVAAMSDANHCYGIEKAETPCRYADDMDHNFKFWMQWFGRSYCPYTLIKGDFFDDRYKDLVQNSTFVFVNNFAFGPTVDHQLKGRFAELRDGARIVSSKAFCPMNFRITERNLTDIGTIVQLQELQPKKGSVSWTGKPVSYYLHTIDRAKLMKYFSDNNMRNPRAKLEEGGKGTRGRGKLSNGSHSTESNSSNESNHKEEVIYGPTTRKAWSEYISNTLSNSKQSNGMHSSNSQSSSNEVDENDNNSSSAGKTKKKTRGRVGRPRKNPEPEPEPKPDSPPTTDIDKKRKKGERRPGRPPKVKPGRKSSKDDPLDLLHEKTMASISNNVSQLNEDNGDGCIDMQLGNSDSAKSLSSPSVVPVVPRDPALFQADLDNFLDAIKQQMTGFYNRMQTPEFRASVQKQVDEEKKRNETLLALVAKEERAVIALQQSGTQLLKGRLAEVGIDGQSQQDILEKANGIVTKNKALQIEWNQMQQQVSYMEAITSHNQLLKAIADQSHQSQAKKSTAKAKTKKSALQDAANLTNNDSNSFADYIKKTNGLYSTNPNSISSHSNSSNHFNAATNKSVANGASKNHYHHHNPSLAKLDQRSLSSNSSSTQPVTQALLSVPSTTMPTIPTAAADHFSKAPTPLPETTFQIPNANDRINSMIVAALNDKTDRPASAPTSNSSSKPEPKPKKEPKKRGPKPKSGSSELPKADATHKYTPSPRHRPDDIDSFAEATFSIKQTPPQDPSSEDKRPLTLTLVIDRRDNSGTTYASVKSPSKSPEKSPKHNEVKRKNGSYFSDHIPKKLRASKYSSEISEHEKKKGSLSSVSVVYDQKTDTVNGTTIHKEDLTINLRSERTETVAAQTGQTKSWHSQLDNRFEKIFNMAPAKESTEATKTDGHIESDAFLKQQQLPQPPALSYHPPIDPLKKPIRSGNSQTHKPKFRILQDWPEG